MKDTVQNIVKAERSAFLLWQRRNMWWRNLVNGELAAGSGAKTEHII
jgi:hypothetical protein